MRSKWLITLAAAATLAAPLTAAPEKHVRVVLDISQSMRGTKSAPANDPSGHALLAVSLLYDLARYELGPDGSFQLLPFDVPPATACPGAVPRSASGAWITPSAAGRDAFIRRILDLPYDAPCTFFYPYLDSAVRDLETTRKGSDVKRIIVLVTDGLTEDKTKSEEANLLREIAPRLRNAGIEFYLLAFGPTAGANEAFFRPIFEFGSASGVNGDLLSDPTGTQLVENMIRIFEMGFAYKSEVVSGKDLDLRGGNEQRHVAVVSVYDPPREPRFTVTAPGGRAVSPKGPLAPAVGREVAKAIPAGSGKPLSYGVLWINGPADGKHSFADAAAPRKIAILRPRNLRIELEKNSLEVAMLDSPMKLQAIVRPADGGSGDPGDVSLQFRVFAVKRDGGYAYSPPEDWIPAVAGSGKYVPGKGRVFDIVPVFQQASAFNKTPQNGKWWDGYVEVRAVSDRTELAKLDKGQHPVNIYPRLSLKPDPEIATVMNGRSATLQGGQVGCAPFKFRVEGQPLRDADYTLAASIDEKLLTGPLRGAKLRLSGQDLKQWIDGRKIGGRALTEAGLELCLTAPKRTSGGKDLKLPVQFALWMEADDPYKKLDVVKPLTITSNLEPVGLWGRLWPLWLLLLTLLIGALLLALLRGSIAFPKDFRTALSEGLAPAAPTVRALAPAAIWHAWRARPPRPVSSLTGRLLGHVVPTDGDLYQFRPAPGFAEITEEDERGGDLLTRQADGSVLLQAHRLYRVKGEGAVHHLRLEFTPPSAKP